MPTEDVAPSKAWTDVELIEMSLNIEGEYRIHLVVSDGETGEVFGCSEFMIIRNGNNLTFSGVRRKDKETTS